MTLALPDVDMELFSDLAPPCDIIDNKVVRPLNCPHPAAFIITVQCARCGTGLEQACAEHTASINHEGVIGCTGYAPHRRHQMTNAIVTKIEPI